jgi:hypothetical protein
MRSLAVLLPERYRGEHARASGDATIAGREGTPPPAP